MRQPPFNDPSEAIQHIKDNYSYDNITTFSWRQVAEFVSRYMDDNTSKAVMWNVAHKKYKCPPDVAVALRKRNLLKSAKRWRFFFEVANEEEYKAFKKLLGDMTFAEWVMWHAGENW